MVYIRVQSKKENKTSLSKRIFRFNNNDVYTSLIHGNHRINQRLIERDRKYNAEIGTCLLVLQIFNTFPL